MRKITQITVVITVLLLLFYIKASDASTLLPGLSLHKENDSVVIYNVEKGSETWEVGIRIGDILLKINDQEINILDDYVEKTRSINSNEIVTFRLSRNGKEYVIIKDGYNFQAELPETELQPQITNKSNTSKSGFVNSSKAIYEIPLSARVDEVLEWCNEYLVEIRNWTEYDCDKEVRRLASIRDLETNELKIEEASISNIEEEVVRRMASCGKDTSGRYEFIGLQHIQETLKIRHNPSFMHDDKEYYLNPVFKSMMLYFDGVQEPCEEDGITKYTYVLALVPSDMSKLKEKGVYSIDIYFYYDHDGIGKSYAVAIHYSTAFRYSATGQLEDSKSSEELFDLTYQALDKKYGQHVYTDVDELLTDYHYPYSLIYYLTNYPYDTSKTACLYWGEKIFLLGGIDTYAQSKEEYLRWGGIFTLMYIEPLLAQKVYNIRETALTQCEKAHYQNKNSLEASMNDEF